jgi:hypothetical protein
MSMTAGTVTVADNETVSGAGLARALYDADAATMTLMTLPTLGATTAPYSAARPVAQSDIDLVQTGRLLTLRDVARRANAYASAIVTYLQANAKAHVTNQSLGRTPNPNDPDTAIAAPSAPVDIPIT